jgi:hypothetical protein
MIDKTQSKTKIFLAQLVIVLVIALIIIGICWYDLSVASRQRLWQNIVDRPGGPMKFRFILQPFMATLAAWHDGVTDSKLGRPPYFWTIVTSRAKRGSLLREGLISTARVILLGLVMDTIYQIIVFGTFYPVETVIVALLLAFVPYVVMRGPIARVVLWWRNRASTSESR